MSKGFWAHTGCAAEAPDLTYMDLVMMESSDRRLREDEHLLFGSPELIEVHKGVLVRWLQGVETYGTALGDDLMAGIIAESGNKDVINLIDLMEPEHRSHLVGATSETLSNVLLGWADTVPPQYESGSSHDGVRVRSVVVDHVPRRLREMLPTEVRQRL